MTMEERLALIRLLLLDVDGVLTDGRIVYSDSGEEIKRFSSKDGLGVRLLMDHGIEVGIITARTSAALMARCRNLGIARVMDGVRDKRTALQEILDQTGLNSDTVAYMGDDLIDLPVMARVGLSIAPADASPDVLAKADLVVTRCGGDGAVREACEAILKAKGLWGRILDGYAS